MVISQTIKKITSRFTLTLLFVTVSISSFVRLSHAQGDGTSASPPPFEEGASASVDTPGSAELINPIGGSGITNISDFIARLLEIVVLIGIPIVAFFIIYTGFKFVTSQGDPKAIEAAKLMLLYTIIGSFLVLGAFVLAEAIGGTIRQLAT